MGTITADTVAKFPRCPAYGFTVEPRYLVKAIERDGGFERVDRRWSRPLMFYTAVPMGDKADIDAQAVLQFWHAVGGMSYAFRFTDYTDFQSCETYGTPSATDQPLEVANSLDASGTVVTVIGYQLVKTYTAGTFTQVREIYKPIGSTILVANEDGEAQDDWTLDESTGLLVPGDTFSGTPSSWGGQFDVYARFNTNLSLAITNLRIQNASFTLRERRMNVSLI